MLFGGSEQRGEKVEKGEGRGESGEERGERGEREERGGEKGHTFGMNVTPWIRRTKRMIVRSGCDGCQYL